MKNKKGISLIVLIITIIIIIILAGAVILNLADNNPIDSATKAQIMSDIDAFKSDLTVNIGAKYAKDTMLDLDDVDVTGEDNSLWKEYIPSIIGKKVDGELYTKVLEIKNGELYFKTSEKEELNDETCSVIIEALGGNMSYPVLADGSWDGKVNSPKIEGTGLTAVYYENNEWKELTVESSKEEWSKWYDYDSKKWANAKSKDGSMWVWIPRYAYQITSGLYQSTAGQISVKFIDIDNKNGDIVYSTNYPTVDKTNHKMNDYVVHPAFTTNIENGGWDEELPGIWVAKYEAGFQASTTDTDATVVVNGEDEIVYSNLNYYTYHYDINAINQDLTKLPKMSYPVFKAKTYSYNNISASDAFLLAQEVDTAGFYGLSNVDSHMMKNSEWGAVAYLSWSNYGKASEVSINNQNLDNLNSKNIYAITGYGGNDASCTGNITGVFDMVGGLSDRTASLMNNNLKIHDWHKALAIDKSNKYLTKYENTYELCDTYGDAIKEISSLGDESNAWNNDYSRYLEDSSNYRFIFSKGGYYGYTTQAGIFCFDKTVGSPEVGNGFRVVLAF